jgi:hypothetical protein
LCDCLHQRYVAAGDRELVAFDSNLVYEHAQVLLGERFVAEQLPAQNASESVDMVRPDGL